MRCERKGLSKVTPCFALSKGSRALALTKVEKAGVRQIFGEGMIGNLALGMLPVSSESGV